MNYQGLFSEVLENRPELAYYSHLDDQGFSEMKRRRLRGLFSDVQSRFLGQIGGDLRAGRAPTRKWNTFLEDFNWNEYYSNTVPPSQRNSFLGRFVPRILYDF